MSENDRFILARMLTDVAKEKSIKSVIQIHSIEKAKDGVTREKAELIGTGLLINVSGKMFVLTAKHVIDEREVLGCDALAFNPGNNGQHLSVLLHEASEFVCSDDRDDVAVIALLPPVENAVRQFGDLEPLSLSALCPLHEEVESEPIMIVGYPGELSEQLGSELGVRSTALSYLSPLSKQPITGNVRFKEERDLLIPFEQSEEHNRTLLDSPCVFPDPRGISGGPVWSLRLKKPFWIPDDIQVIGICRRWYDERKLVCATKIWVVLELMKTRWPELGDEIDNRCYLIEGETSV